MKQDSSKYFFRIKVLKQIAANSIEHKGRPMKYCKTVSGADRLQIQNVFRAEDLGVYCFIGYGFKLKPYSHS